MLRLLFEWTMGVFEKDELHRNHPIAQGSKVEAYSLVGGEIQW